MQIYDFFRTKILSSWRCEQTNVGNEEVFLSLVDLIVY